VGLQVWAAWSLYRTSRAARSEGYRKRESLAFSYASRTMRWGGVIVLAFIVYHILHFTTGQAHPGFQTGQVYDNVVAGFNVWWASAIYLVAMVPLGLHLYHGTWSLLQTLGANHPRYNHLRRRLALVVAVVVVLGNLSFPIAVLTGVVD